MHAVTVLIDDENRRWSIGNDSVECQVQCDDGQLSWTLVDRQNGGRRYGPSAAPQLCIDGQLASRSGAVTGSELPYDDGSRELRITLGASDGSVSRTCSFQVFPGAPFVRVWGTVDNTSGRPLRITGSEILRLELVSSETLTLFHVEQFSWVYARDFFSQRQVGLVVGRAPAEIRMGSFPSHYWGPTSCGWLALRDGRADSAGGVPNQGTGLVAGIEFNGKSRVRAWAEPERTLLVSTIDDLHHPVAPGETFAVPACFVGCFAGDWDEAGYVTQRFAERYVHPPMPDSRYPWVQYNSWAYGQEIDEAQQFEAIERCAAMGVEVAVMDLGWAVQIGEWRHHPKKFPNGLKPLAEHAHRLGMKFGVHLALAQCNVDAPIAREHPDWLTHRGNDYFGAAPLCLGHRPCREWLIEQIVQLIDEYAIDYIVQDGEDMVKLCGSSAHTHAPGDSNFANSAEGLDAVIAAVREQRPNLVWENCEDGGCMMTYRMARLCHSSITVDNIATYATRQGIYGASYPFSPRYSVRYMQDDPTPYTLRSVLFGGPMILMQRVTEWTPEQMAATREAIAQYKELRALVRDAKVIHLLPPLANVDGVGWGWDAIQAVSADQSLSVVLVFRARGDVGRRSIRPRGLHPNAGYRVVLHDRGTTLELSGEAMAGDGIELELPELASELIRIEVNSGQ